MSDAEDCTPLTARGLEPLPRVPPIQQQPGSQQQQQPQQPTGKRWSQMRPPPVKQSQLAPIRKEGGPVLERNITLLSVASISDSVSALSPRSYDSSHHKHTRKHKHALNSSSRRPPIHVTGHVAQRAGLTPTDSHVEQQQQQQQQNGFVASNAPHSPRNAVNHINPPPAVIERNMTLVSLMSEM